jgi:hypothetical protein
VTQPPYEPGPPAGWQPPARKPKAPLVLGILIGAVVPFFGILAAIVIGSVGSSTTLSGIAGLLPFVWALLVLAVGAGLLFSDRTRRWGLGILIGFFGMLIIGAGVCVTTLVVVLASYSTGG